MAAALLATVVLLADRAIVCHGFHPTDSPHWARPQSRLQPCRGGSAGRDNDLRRRAERGRCHGRAHWRRGCGSTSDQRTANATIALDVVGATGGDVVQWTVLFVDGVDLSAAYAAIATDLASDEPPLVTAAGAVGLGVPGALVEIGAIGAVLP